MPDLGVKSHSLDIPVCEPKHGQCRRVIRSTTLKADKARFNNVYPSNAVTASDIVQGFKELKRAGHRLATLDLELDRDSRSEGDREFGGNIRGVERI